MNNFPFHLTKGKILLEKYKIIKFIEKDNFIQIILCKDIFTNELFIIKIEQKLIHKKKGILETESYFLNKLKSIIGIPKLYQIGYYNPKTIISIQASLGYSLSDIFDKYYRHFNIKDITMIAIQILERIKIIHSKNIVHYNINPDNLFIDFAKFQNVIYLNNFIHAIKLENNNDNDNKYWNYNKNILNKNLIFSSINSMKGVKIYKKDDLESLGYILIFLLKGGLPWELLAYNSNLTKEEKNRKIYQIKKYLPLNKLCEGIPEEFKLFIEYIKKLNCKEEIDFNYCFNLFYTTFKKNQIINDGIFSWYQEKRVIQNSKKKSFYKFLWHKKFIQRKTSEKIIFNKYNLNNDNENFIIEKNSLKKSNSCFLNIDINPYLDNKEKNNFKNELKLSSSKEKDYSIEGEIEQEQNIKYYKKKKIKNLKINEKIIHIINKTQNQSKDDYIYKTKNNSKKKEINRLNFIFTDYNKKTKSIMEIKDKHEKSHKNNFSNNINKIKNTSFKTLNTLNNKNEKEIINKSKIHEKKKAIRLLKKNSTIKLKTPFNNTQIKTINKPNKKININLNKIPKNNRIFPMVAKTTKNYSNSNIKSKIKKSNYFTLINNGISKINLIQNISNIYVTKSFFEERHKYISNKTKTIVPKTSNNVIKKINKGKIKNLILNIKGNKSQENKIKINNNTDRLKIREEKDDSLNTYYLIN